jgi:hypothetical protein
MAGKGADVFDAGAPNFVFPIVLGGAYDRGADVGER